MRGARPEPPGVAALEELDALLARTNRRRPPRWRWLAVGAALALILGGAFVAGRGLGRNPSLIRSPLIGKQVPAFRLPALGGGEIDVASYRGDVVVVNFWASWCVPCREEAPQLQAFAEAWSGQGVTVIGVVFNDSESEAAAFRDRFGLTFPQALDPSGRTAIDFGVFGVPETYVIDRRGTVMAKFLGAVDAATLDEAIGAVEEGQTMSAGNERYRTGPG